MTGRTTSMDPLNLPEPCLTSILKNLSGMEVLKLMEVSKSWKEYLESRKSLMDQVMDGIIVTPTIDNVSIPMIDYLKSSSRRRYKHMKSPLVLHRQFETPKVIYFPFIELHALTLESLTVPDNDFSDSFKITGTIITLPTHKVYSIDTYLNPQCSFPVLIHLKITTDYQGDFYITYEDVKKLLAKFPKLETFYAESSQIEEDEVVSNDEEIVADIYTDCNQPKLKCIHFEYFHKIFIQDHQNTLVKLEINQFNYKYISWLIQHLKVLKSLSVFTIEIYEIDEDMDEVPNIHHQNESIEVFKVCQSFVYEIFGEAAYVGAEVDLKQILLALPSLRAFDLRYGVTKEILEFIASNMRYLKKLSCYNRTNESLQHVYEEIQNNPDRYVNSTFEFIEIMSDDTCHYKNFFEKEIF